MSGDLKIVRELAKKVAEIAALPEQAELVRLWKKSNGLNQERPMFMIDQVCWNEMNVDDELTPVCESAEMRWYEGVLRQTLYRYRHMRDDRPVRSYINVGKAWGIRDFDIPAITQDNNAAGMETHLFVDQLPDEESVIEKLKMPVVFHDEAETARRKERAEEILGGILGVRMTGYDGYFHYWDRISMWRGVEPIMYDMVDRPEFIHFLLRHVMKCYMSQLDQLETLGLIDAGMEIIHCTGADNDVMGDDCHSAKNSWTYSAPQLFSMVSPEMHEEFDADYIKPWFSRFGLGYYGCCEPEDSKIDVLRKVPNIRKISMSPWVNEENGAEKIGRDFVYSRKPNPAYVAMPSFDENVIRTEFNKTLAATQKYGCPVEFILKDITTTKYQPQRIWEWSRIAAEICGK